MIPELALAREPDEWFVAFIRSGTRRWWKCFTGNNFDHVFTFGYARGHWLLVDWCTFGLKVRLLLDDDIDFIIAGAMRNGTILGMKKQPFYRPAPRLPLYCVSAVKHQLGLRSWSITPQQLFCELRRLGAREMFPETRRALHEQRR